MIRWFAFIIACGLATAAVVLPPAAARTAQPVPSPDKHRLTNGQITIGIDLDHGGSIGYLADAKTGENVVNTHDLGRWIGQSYYSGPRPFGEPHSAWKNWPWNPVSAGDVFGNKTRILSWSNDGKTLYMKARPMQWALNKVPADCTFETWITLDGRTATVRNRLTNARIDTHRYPAMDQELPAVYTIGKLHKLMAYVGDRPFTDGKLMEVPAQAAVGGKPKWSSFMATEHWAAHVDKDDRGLGVVHPGVVRFLGGFYGKDTDRKGGTADDATGYISPIRKEILDADIVYEYEYMLVLDTLANIRKYAVEHRPQTRVPDYRFTRDRQHWHHINASDDGLPKKSSWRVNLDQDDPQLIGPDTFWLAADAPKIMIRCAHKTQGRTAELYWRQHGQLGFSTEQRMTFDINNDGKFHTYELDLSKHAKYTGALTMLRWDPVLKGGPGEHVDVEFISGSR